MAKLVTGGKVVLVWDDGKTVVLGTVGIDYGKTEATMTVKTARRFRQRIGWELVRMGFREMFPKMKWSMKQNDQG